MLQAASQRYKLPMQSLLAANGSTEILYQLPRVCSHLTRAVIPAPAYVDYAKICWLSGLQVEYIRLALEQDFILDLERLADKLHEPALVFLAQPNNPTGRSLPADKILELAQTNPQSLFVLDEAFADFLPDQNRLYARQADNILVLLSLTKFYAIPGLRLGLAAGNPDLVQHLQKIMPPWSVNCLAQEIGALALQDLHYQEQSRKSTTELRTGLQQLLQDIPGLQIFSSEANFLLCRLLWTDKTATSLQQELVQQGILIRDCSNFQELGPEFMRIAVRSAQENQKLAQALGQALNTQQRTPVIKTPVAGASKNSKTPALMLQGVSSNAGKSILATALCRILLQDGFQPAPFKAQNMSLNSFVTKAGGEMGRAQVLQAQACRLDPDVLMNPVLLKPNSETGSQVIVLGKAVRNMDVQDYILFKEQIKHKTQQAYDQLAAQAQVMVLEGAGSPAEINLKAHDLTNMSMARHAQARVLLVGDIDRGGVFASFVGTMELLEKWEQELLCGFVINKFRGQKKLLDPALDFTLQRTGKPVLGIAPFIPDLGLPEEDSVSFKAGWDKNKNLDRKECVHIACIDLPHISNFTDLEPLLPEPDVKLSIVKNPTGLKEAPDLLILPGSKNVLSDLDFLRKTGLDRLIKELAREGKTQILGICGGFQILGEKVADPLGVESNQEAAWGLGLLPVITEMGPDKTLIQAQGVHLPSGQPLRGYEIHHGQTRVTSQEAVQTVLSNDHRQLGFGHSRHPIWGTYLHGLFDADHFRRWLIDGLRLQKGLAPLEKQQTVYDLEDKLDLLADTVRNNLDLDFIYQQLGLC